MAEESAYGASTGQAGPLNGLRVIDAATLLAGPMIATNLGDFGADVIKVEHPRGDSLRAFGWSHEGTSIWWKTASRNKRVCTLNLSHPRGQSLMRDLVRDADVLIENFRPGTMERWNLDYERLREDNPSLVMVRVTGFGQSGPYASMPGFGTLAEAMSGLASVLGERDRPPIVPPLPMADGIAALYGTFATLIALYHRDCDRGLGQCIDVNLFESMVSFMAPQVTAYDVLGVIPERDASHAPFSAPRGVYATRDAHWVAISTSAQSVANRLFVAIGHPELASDPELTTNAGRLAQRARIDAIVVDWMSKRDLNQILDHLREHDVAVAPIYTPREVALDPHLREREMFFDVEDAELGSVLMHAVVPRMSVTPGEVSGAGRPLGADNEEIMCGLLGMSRNEFDSLAADGVI